MLHLAPLPDTAPFDASPAGVLLPSGCAGHILRGFERVGFLEEEQEEEGGRAGAEPPRTKL